MESPKHLDAFKEPNLLHERGEFSRVAETFSLDEGVLLYVAETEGRLVPLTEDIWGSLDNTDSNRFSAGDWDAVAEHAVAVGRDWMSIRDNLQRGVLYDAPIILKFKDTYHLVSGNTRLMVARALGLTPQVWLFEVYDNES